MKEFENIKRRLRRNGEQHIHIRNMKRNQSFTLNIIEAYCR